MQDSAELTGEEEAALKSLARRQRESESAESRILAKYASRAALAKQLWTSVFAIAVAIVFTTIYVMNIQNTVQRNSGDISQLRVDVSENARTVNQLRLDMKDKKDRNEK